MQTVFGLLLVTPVPGQWVGGTLTDVTGPFHVVVHGLWHVLGRQVPGFIFLSWQPRQPREEVRLSSMDKEMCVFWRIWEINSEVVPRRK